MINRPNFNFRLSALLMMGSVLIPPVCFAQGQDANMTRIMKAVEEIRGLEFKKSIDAENQSPEDFQKYLAKQIALEIPPEKAKSYGRVIQKIGLYRGPVIEDFALMVESMLASQAAAYYDPTSSTFFVVKDMGDQMMNDVMYAHELYHGMQDQHFNLSKYFIDPQLEDEINDDEAMARQAVVEGEASLIMTLFMMQGMDTSQLGPLIQMQADMPPETLRMMAKQQISAAEALGDAGPDLTDLEKSLEALDDIPPFMIESLMGAYLKGMAFVFVIQQEGWDKVTELYTNPPTSTEQILHPEKWLSGEDPIRMKFPEVSTNENLSEWKVLEENTIGELQWRTIFNEHGMRNVSMRVAAGWNGDRFMVLENTESEELALLLSTSWDTVAEAKEFAENYETLLTAKYAAGEVYSEVRLSGRNVDVIEGGEEDDLEAFQHILSSVERKQQ